MLRLHQSGMPHQLKPHDTDELLTFLPDCMHYALQYAGYDYERLSPAKNKKEDVWAAIVKSIDQDVPVLMKMVNSQQWNTVGGYREEKQELLGLDVNHHYDKVDWTFAEPAGYLEKCTGTYTKGLYNARSRFY